MLPNHSGANLENGDPVKDGGDEAGPVLEEEQHDEGEEGLQNPAAKKLLDNGADTDADVDGGGGRFPVDGNRVGEFVVVDGGVLQVVSVAHFQLLRKGLNKAKLASLFSGTAIWHC